MFTKSTAVGAKGLDIRLTSSPAWAGYEADGAFRSDRARPPEALVLVVEVIGRMEPEDKGLIQLSEH